MRVISAFLAGTIIGLALAYLLVMLFATVFGSGDGSGFRIRERKSILLKTSIFALEGHEEVYYIHFVR